MSLLNMLKKGVKRTLFTTPSHNQKAQFDKFLDTYYRLDFSEIEGFDNLHNPSGEIFKAQIRCGKIYGAKSLLPDPSGSNELHKLKPNTHGMERSVSAMPFMMQAFFLPQPNKSIVQETRFSNTPSTVVKAANDINTKKRLPQTLPNGR